MGKKPLGLCIAVLASAGLVAQVQQKDSTDIQYLDEVVVTDTRFEIKREQSGKTVIKIGAEELQRSYGQTLAQVINVKSGIEIAGSRGREGAVLGVFARGGRGRQVLVIIDGIRVSDPSSFSSEYDLRLLPIASIESIEIIKGAASTLYGTNAATAVINITTKQASEKGISANFQSSIGTNQTAGEQNYNFGNFENNARVSGTVDKLSYTLDFAARNSEGLSAIVTPENEEDTFSNVSTNLKIGYQISERFNLGIFGNQTKLKTDFDESFGLVDAPYQFISEQKRVGINASHTYKGGGIYLNAAYSDFESENISAFPSSFVGQNYVLDLYNKTSFANGINAILGVNYIKDDAQFSADQDFTIIDPYLNMVYVSEFGLNVNAGARLNNHSEYGTQLVYNLNPSFSLQTDKGYLKFLGSFATSYITPSLTQLFGDFGANPDLEPEENRTLEGGVEYALSSGLRLSALYFNRREENFVFFDNATGTYGNADNIIKAQGLELEANWKPLDKLVVSTNYTFTERKGDNAIRIPKHKANLLCAYDLSERTSASFSYSYTGERSDTDFNVFPFVDVPLDAFSLVGLHLQHKLIEEKLRIFLNMENLLNEEFTEVLGFTTRGRNISMGINLTL
ncbi:TonB-dependent receptor plug domain-containing protein [Poritiphilus flavus]|uniref:TonB-dependent receptor n=1 Tax=Poritiphilus flavus TaxID=2697053 RepID=A0A6L9EAC5_9FLAO|nr:TonB-dependent receptor plug domain-containing protein [Poritiphilus flavus]NAS11696.1 TonB-dependent receptor [Poritiphilus flavus]